MPAGERPTRYAPSDVQSARLDHRHHGPDVLGQDGRAHPPVRARPDRPTQGRPDPAGARRPDRARDGPEPVRGRLPGPAGGRLGRRSSRWSPRRGPTSWRSRRASSSTRASSTVCERLADRDRVVIVDGLNRDFLGRPFGPMPELLAIAEEVVMLSAICMVCGEEASRTQRLVDGRPARRATRSWSSAGSATSATRRAAGTTTQIG